MTRLKIGEIRDVFSAILLSAATGRFGVAGGGANKEWVYPSEQTAAVDERMLIDSFGLTVHGH